MTTEPPPTQPPRSAHLHPPLPLLGLRAVRRDRRAPRPRRVRARDEREDDEDGQKHVADVALGPRAERGRAVGDVEPQHDGAQLDRGAEGLAAGGERGGVEAQEAEEGRAEEAGRGRRERARGRRGERRGRGGGGGGAVGDDELHLGGLVRVRVRGRAAGE